MLIRLLAKIFFYSALVWLSAYVVWLDAPAITENSWTERAEIMVAGMTALIFISIAILNPQRKHLSIFMSAVFAMCIIRELDWYLIYEVGGMSLWKWIVIIISAGVVWFIVKNRKNILLETEKFIDLPAFGFWLSAFLILFVFSRVVAYRPFWELVMHEHYMPFVRRVAEEGTELLGYCLFFISAVEYFLFNLKEKKTLNRSV